MTLIDDGTIPGLFGTSPFDDEGVATRRTVVIERGVLKSWLTNTYAARNSVSQRRAMPRAVSPGMRASDTIICFWKKVNSHRTRSFEM